MTATPDKPMRAFEWINWLWTRDIISAALADALSPEAETWEAAIRADERERLLAELREPTEAMLAATVDTRGTMRILEFTTPEEHSKPFLVARYCWRAMLAAFTAQPWEG